MEAPHEPLEASRQLEDVTADGFGSSGLCTARASASRGLDCQSLSVIIIIYIRSTWFVHPLQLTSPVVHDVVVT